MYLHCCLYGVLYDMFDVTLYIVQIEYLRGIHSHIKLEVYIFDISLNRTLNMSVRVSVLIWPVHLRMICGI